MTKRFMTLASLLMVVVHISSARIVPFPNYERASKVVDRLMAIHNIPQENHTILKRNSVYNLAGFFSAKDMYLASLISDEKLNQRLSEANFWAEKLQRDLMVPYTNEEVDKRFTHIQAEVDYFLRYLNFANYNNSPVQLYVFGSIVKGRWGANSDIDIFVDSSDKDLLRRLEQGIYDEAHPSFSGNVEVITSFFEPANILDPLVPVSMRELKNLKELYARILQDIGFRLTGSGKTLDVVRAPVPPKMFVEFNPIEDRVFYLTNRTHALMHQVSEQFMAFAPNASVAAKRIAEKLISSVERLQQDWTEVESDLLLIREGNPSARLHRIRKVIDAQSWTKMHQEGMVDYMLHVAVKQKKTLGHILGSLKP